jgi:hypothetical protein
VAGDLVATTIYSASARRTLRRCTMIFRAAAICSSNSGSGRLCIFRARFSAAIRTEGAAIAKVTIHDGAVLDIYEQVCPVEDVDWCAESVISELDDAYSEAHPARGN